MIYTYKRLYVKILYCLKLSLSDTRNKIETLDVNAAMFSTARRIDISDFSRCTDDATRNPYFLMTNI